LYFSYPIIVIVYYPDNSNPQLIRTAGVLLHLCWWVLISFFRS